MPDITALLGFMVQGRSSDLFVAEGRPPAYRVDGNIVLTAHPPSTRAEIEAFLAKVLSPAVRATFDKTGDFDLAVSLPDLGRFRLNVHVQRGALGIVIRRIPSGQHTFESLGLPKALGNLVSERRGLVLVVGATGSGKSTTMAALVHHVNASSARHIVTLEDPIEFVHDDLKSIVTQREIGVDTADYASALRHVVRESPDVIVIGELRDQDSMQVALSAALTGHLVLASLHTADAVQTVQRVLGWYPDSAKHQVCMDLAGCLVGIVAQRLLPRADGKGRVPAVELLAGTPGVKRLLREMRLEELPDILQAGEGVQSFQRALLRLYEHQVVTLEAGMAFATHPEEFRLAAQGFERSVAALAAEHGDLPSVGAVDLKTLLHVAIRSGASDIHINVGMPPILRVHGDLWPLKTDKIGPGDARRLLFGLLTHSQRETFELERELDFAITLTGKHRCRVNAHYQRGTIAMAIRLIPMQIPDIRSLGLPQAIQELAQKQQGLVLVTGPTGSGKSTTLASLIHLINSGRNCHIITVEDPIEFVHPNGTATVEQREIGADTKSFAAALKYILRQDPDVILVGEMRDVETISAALTAAETGHLVFATLHTNDAPQTIDRIIDVFPPFQQGQIRVALSACLTAVISQRLLARADGKGRVPAFEVLVGNTAVRAIIREGKTFQLQSIIETSYRDGMVTLERSMGDHVRAGTVSFDEALRFARSPASLKAEVDKLNEPPAAGGIGKGGPGR
ncbi:MAG: PilT/PilU family type 4a pilus ATPase [Deltaproteobacteria bacterium]|nr:PilT/PilU family type 4a pilus ATPase [Deltaproteobacteria bacterium]